MIRELWTSGEIYRLFIKEDAGTIMRKPNIRRFAKEKGIFCSVRRTWLIDVDEFMAYINPNEIPRQEKMPIIRTLRECRIMFNQKHDTELTAHDTEYLVPSDEFFCYKYGNRWLINYEEFEAFLRKHFGIKPPEESKEKSH